MTAGRRKRQRDFCRILDIYFVLQITMSVPESIYVGGGSEQSTAGDRFDDDAAGLRRDGSTGMRICARGTGRGFQFSSPNIGNNQDWLILRLVILTPQECG